jgi:tRNA(Met) C34 N-acetyltransferase TmcA
VKPFKSSTTRPDKHSLNDLEYPAKIVANRFSQKVDRKSVSNSSFAIILTDIQGEKNNKKTKKERNPSSNFSLNHTKVATVTP